MSQAVALREPPNERMERLALAVRAGDQDAMDQMLRMAATWMRSQVRARDWFLPTGAGDESDMVQEALIGIYRAVWTWDPAKSTFMAYAWLCGWRDIQTLVRKAGRQKWRALDGALSLDRPTFLDGDTYHERLRVADTTGVGADPADVVMGRLAVEAVWREAAKGFSLLERQVLALIAVEGLSYLEAAARLGRREKAVDNTMQRLRKKLRLTAREAFR